MPEKRPQDMSDHDLLIRIDERVKDLDTDLNNHLKHHWAWTKILAVALVGAVVTILLRWTS